MLRCPPCLTKHLFVSGYKLLIRDSYKVFFSFIAIESFQRYTEYAESPVLEARGYFVAPTRGFEPPTPRLGGECSILLSYADKPFGVDF